MFQRADENRAKISLRFHRRRPPPRAARLPISQILPHIFSTYLICADLLF